MEKPRSARGPVRTLLRLTADAIEWLAAALQSRHRRAMENLFLRKQLALYVARPVKPRRADDATRAVMVVASRSIAWRHLLTVVKPDTLIRWPRQGFRLFWRWKSRRVGRPRIPREVPQSIAQMATADVTWGDERIVAELQLKHGRRVSPRYGAYDARSRTHRSLDTDAPRR